MKLALSVRVAESFRDKRVATMTLADLTDLAVNEGYHALCMRASQLGTHTPTEEVTSSYQDLYHRKLVVSMVTGDFPSPENTDVSPAALHNITPWVCPQQSFPLPRVPSVCSSIPLPRKWYAVAGRLQPLLG